MKKYLLSFLFLLISQIALAMNPCELALQKVDDSVWGSKLLNMYESYNYDGQQPPIGVEVEGLVPRSTSLEQILVAVKSAVQNFLPKAQVVIMGAQGGVLVSKDRGAVGFLYKGRQYRIEVKPEVDLGVSFSKKAIEITSPILKTKEDAIMFRHVIQSLSSQVGFKHKPTRAGVHIHVDMHQATVAEIIMLTKVFASVESEVLKKFSVIKKRQRKYAKSVKEPAKYFQIIMDVMKLKKEEIATIFMNRFTRNRTLNLQSLDRFGTVEFRLFNSTVNSEELEAMMEFSMALVKAVREKDPRFIKLLSETPADQELDLQKLSEALGLEWDQKDEVFNRIYKTSFRESLKQRFMGLSALTSAMAASTAGILIYQLML